MTDNSATRVPYRVLARKYRPQNFDDLIGQAPMVTTLTNAFASGRIAQAYMLTGVRGVGKTTTARILARALNYRRGEIDRPTIDLREEGEHCRAIMEGRHVDVIEMDAASHTGIDDIRDIIESVQYAPAVARYKVYIVDEVHMLSKNAFNGLLKTLEEPPPHLKFVFATTEIGKVPVTVLSRCQRFDLRRIETDVLVAHLRRIAEAEKVVVEDAALALVARAAEGSVRDALSILDQAIAHAAGTVEAESVRSLLGLADRARVTDLFEAVMKGDVAAALQELRDQYDSGAEPAVVMADLAAFVHFVTRLKFVPASARDPTLAPVERERGSAFAEKLPVRLLDRSWQILSRGIAEIQASEKPLAAADMVLVRLAHAASLPTPDELIRKLQDAGGSAGATERPAPAGPAPAGPPPREQVRRAAGPAAGAAADPQPRAEPATETGTVAVESFEALVLMAEQKRDLKLRSQLRRNVRLVGFADRRMEINLVDGTPRDFVPELGRKLQAWTGNRWTIAVSREGGAPTLEEREAAESAERTDAALQDPTVNAILRQFPGSRVVDVRLRDTGHLDAIPDAIPDAGESLDDIVDDEAE